MYNIDINFLKDRKLDDLVSPTAFKRQSAASSEEQLPMLIGGGVGLALIAITGGALLFINAQSSNRSSTIAQLESEIERLQGKNQEVRQIQTQIDNAQREIGILVSVFDQLKPWSAMLSEIANVVPNNVQIQSIAQSEDQSLTINGYANSFAQVNDLFLTLKNSPLLDGEKTKLENTGLIDNPSTVIFDRAQLDGDNEVLRPAGIDDIELPQIITYNINTAITDESSQQYLNQLNSNGAIGLVSRLSTLQRKGVLDIKSPTTPEKPLNEGEAN